MRDLPPREWPAVLKALADDTGLDFWATVATLAVTAGKGGYLVHNLSMIGDDGDEFVRIIGKDQGIVNGKALIERMTRPAGNTTTPSGSAAYTSPRILPWIRP